MGFVVGCEEEKEAADPFCGVVGEIPGPSSKKEYRSSLEKYVLLEVPEKKNEVSLNLAWCVIYTRDVIGLRHL